VGQETVEQTRLPAASQRPFLPAPVPEPRPTTPAWLDDPARADVLLERLAGRLTAHRRARIEAVLARRTRWVTLALEDIYQPHNAAAVLRSCDGFGVQDVHIIENFNPFALRSRKSNVSMGTEHWLTLHRSAAPKNEAPDAGEAQPATAAALAALRARGYRLAALTLRGSPVELAEVPLDRPLALLIGTELTGLSPTAHALAEVQVRLPMEGFAQSFNLSVCAAVCLYELTRRLRAPRTGIAWALPSEEKRALLYEWLLRDVPGAEELLARWTKE
jgi:tRNA (guanosine-2'-O-)-methyltransferase